MVEIIYLVVLFGFTIFVHEFGHFLSAKLMGIKVEQFSIGLGPKMVSFKKGETEYLISWLIFLGGFVKLEGENPEEAEKIGERSFLKQPVHKKVIVASAGVAQNLIFSVILLWIVFIFGYETLKPVIGNVKENYPAFSAGLKKGDEIIEVNNKKIRTWDELSNIIATSKDEILQIKIIREGKEMIFNIKPKIDTVEDILKDKKKRAFLGVEPAGEIIKIKYGFFEAFDKAVEQTWFFTSLTVKAIYKMILRKIEPEIAGPIGVINITYKVAKTGFLNLLLLFAIININLALVNFLPILPLDGGLVLMFLIEGVIKKPVPLKFQQALMETGWFLLIALMIFVTYKDLLRIFKGG